MSIFSYLTLLTRSLREDLSSSQGPEDFHARGLHPSVGPERWPEEEVRVMKESLNTDHIIHTILH